MEHLNLEVLARLVDEPPGPLERAHLAACRGCSGELRALREQTARLGELAPPAPPKGGWPALERRLRRDGLIRAGRRQPYTGWAPRAAAAVILFVGGVLAGGALAGRDPAPVAVAGSGAEADSADAARTLTEAEMVYLAALRRYSEHTAEGDDVPNPAARIAALGSIVRATGPAHNEAPADPVINGYHLTALGQRDLMLERFAVIGGEEWF